MALMGTLQDAFNNTALRTALWDQFTAGSATITYDATGCSIVYPVSTTSSTDGDLTSDVTYDLTGSQAYMQVLSVASGATNTDNYLQLGTTTNGLRMMFENGTLYAIKYVAGAQTNIASVAYSSTTHLWWRIREASGTTYWETSSDGITYSTLTSQANPITVTSLNALIAGVAFGNSTSPGTFKFNNFNVIPSSSGFFRLL